MKRKHTTHLLVLAAVVLSVALATACDSTPTAPSTANVSGRWAGTTCAPARIASCVIEFNIEQAGTTLTGSWNTTTAGGALTGSVSGSVVTLVMTRADRTMETTLTLRAHQNELSGPYGQSTIALSR